MSELNQFSLSKILGSKMKPVKDAQFGGFNLLQTTAEALRARELNTLDQHTSRFTIDQDRVVAAAFEDVRDGASPDSILWDRQLMRRFNQRCRELGIDAPDALLNRRLLNIRKNKSRYAAHGIVLSPTTRSEPHPSIVPQHAHVIEFALVRLRYRYGASIDDILLAPDLSELYEQLAQEIAPQLSPVELRLGALYIRKSRFIKKRERELVQSLDLNLLASAWSPPATLDATCSNSVPDSPGLFELKEGTRYLYIARNDDLGAAVGELVTGRAFELVGNSFWKPNLGQMTLQYVEGRRLGGVAMQQWEHRLICELDPVFNWPIHKAA